MIMKLEKIVKDMAEAINVSDGEIIGRTRRQPVAAARQCVCFIASTTGYTYDEIGQFIGRDRVTVYHSVLVTKERLNTRDLLTIRIIDEYVNILCKASERNVFDRVAELREALEGGDGRGVRK